MTAAIRAPAGPPLVLYATDLSGYCARVRIALARKGLVHEDREPPGGYGAAAYRAIVPAGTVGSSTSIMA